MAKSKRAARPRLFSKAGAFLIATNRANVLSMCAGGLIWPAAAYRKHYPDSFDHTNGIPVFIGRIPSKAIRAPGGNGSRMFDVAIEINGAWIEKNRRGETGMEPFCLHRPIPWAAVECLYVRSKADAEDLQVREFGDVPVGAWTVEVRPDVWDDDSDVTLKLPQQEIGTDVTAAAVRADRFGGVLAMLRRFLPNAFPCNIVLARLVSTKVKLRDVPKGRADQPLWLVSIEDVLAGKGTQGEDVDARLLKAAMLALDESHPEQGFDPIQLLDQIAVKAAKSDDSVRDAEIRQWTTYARSAINGEVTPGALDDSGSEIRRGLLLFLLRPEPSRLLKALQSSLKPGPAVHSVAAMFCGFSTMYSRLDRDFKGTSEQHSAVSLALINYLARIASPKEDQEAEAECQLVESADEPAGVARALISIGGLRLSDKKIEPSDDMKKLYFQAKAAGFQFRFDPIWNRFAIEIEAADHNKRTVFVEMGRRSRHSQLSVRFSSDCSLQGDRSAKAMSKAELLALLERNADLDMQCRFGVSRSDGTLQVVAHQLIETLDVPELKAHLEAVTREASEASVTLGSASPSTGSPANSPGAR